MVKAASMAGEIEFETAEESGAAFPAQLRVKLRMSASGRRAV
jgi:hypothetical protein